MFCRLCRQHKSEPKKGANKRAFVEVAAVTRLPQAYRKDYIERHLKTEHHRESIRCQASLSSGTFQKGN